MGRWFIIALILFILAVFPTSNSKSTFSHQISEISSQDIASSNILHFIGIVFEMNKNFKSANTEIIDVDWSKVSRQMSERIFCFVTKCTKCEEVFNDISFDRHISFYLPIIFASWLSPFIQFSSAFSLTWPISKVFLAGCFQWGWDQQ